MDNGIININKTEIKYSCLKDARNRWVQIFYTIIPEKPERIGEQIKTIEYAENELFRIFKIKKSHVIAKRFFSSDLINHYDEMVKYKNRQNTDFFMSVTEQPPIPIVKLVLLGMCLNSNIVKYRDDKIFYFDTGSKLRHIFIENLVDPEADEHSDAKKQTKKIFSLLEEKLSNFNTTIEESVLRTWLYIPHLDADYSGMIKARKEVFDSINLTKSTHYIASTGIQGGAVNQFSRVFMDAYAVVGINKEKVRYIHVPEYMSSADVYGATFERATAIEMGNVKHLFISGTASIDKEGEIVYPGNIAKQTKRTLKNITALLMASHFTKKDLSGFMIYLRDPADYHVVKSIIDEYNENLPVVYVKAAACRPGWLIEIEATAEKLKD